MTGPDIARALHGRRCGRGWIAGCPAHEDRSPSLSIAERDGRVLIHCHAGCSQSDVIAALRGRGLWPERERRKWTHEQRAKWAADRREVERELPIARYWRRAAMALSDELLISLKSGLFDATSPRPRVGELQRLTQFHSWLTRLEGAPLVAEYRSWVDQYPGITAGLVCAAQNLEAVERRALEAYLRLTDPEAVV